MTNYIIRFDDFYVGMEKNNLFKVRDTVIQYSIPAIIGVVPNWQDELDVKQPVEEGEFWKTIRLLQEHGCEIALHGYSHKLFKHNNLLGVNGYGEFAGLNLQEQQKRIKNGLMVLTQHNIPCRMFMAPAHSFDMNTIIALKDSSISIITDGKSFYPYLFQGLLFLPQISSKFKKYPFGVITICLHPQWMGVNDYNELIKFSRIQENNIVSVQVAIDSFKNMNKVSIFLDSIVRRIYFLIKRFKTS
jgi:predicted deacetylase